MPTDNDRYDARAFWLSEKGGYGESDVMEEFGVEYIIVEDEDENGVHKRVVELPKELQMDFVPF